MSSGIKNEGEAQAKQQIFGAGGIDDQAATRLAIAASAPSLGSSARVQAREVIALATASGHDGDHQLTKPDRTEAYIHKNIANANPEFGYRNLTTTDAAQQEGNQEALSEDLDILDGVASGDALAMLRGSSDQTSEDTTIAIQKLFGKAFATHQGLTKQETASLDISTQKQIEENPFDGNRPAQSGTKRSYASKAEQQAFATTDAEYEEGGEDENDAQMSSDPLYAASKEDGLDFYFANTGGVDKKEGDDDDSEMGGSRPSHFQASMQNSGLRRVGMRKPQSSLVDALDSQGDLSQMREGFSLQQRTEGDWDSYDKLDQQRQEDIEKLRFPGSQYLAHQPSMLTTMSTRTASSRSKKTKKNKGASGTMGSTSFS
jgi:hypothetical protein